MNQKTYFPVQVVKDTACRVGCGFADCKGTKTYVCNYMTGQSGFSKPFEPGTPCTDCKTCENNLCGKWVIMNPMSALRMASPAKTASWIFQPEKACEPHTGCRTPLKRHHTNRRHIYNINSEQECSHSLQAISKGFLLVLPVWTGPWVHYRTVRVKSWRAVWPVISLCPAAKKVKIHRGHRQATQTRMYQTWKKMHLKQRSANTTNFLSVKGFHDPDRQPKWAVWASCPA